MDGDRLYQGCEQLGLHLTGKQGEKLLAYAELMIKWNQTYNLTAIKSPEAVISHHLLDSLVLARFFVQHELMPQGKEIIDVGTGAGLPGIPLSIMLPGYRFSLLDANGKKSRFLVQAKIELGLDNCFPINQRVEEYQPEQKYDIVMSRAFASLTDFFTMCRHLIEKDGRFWAMKGKNPLGELRELPPEYEIVHSLTLKVPGMEKERHLLVGKYQQTDWS